jgi:spermidine/putrescine-binding protein
VQDAPTPEGWDNTSQELHRFIYSNKLSPLAEKDQKMLKEMIEANNKKGRKLITATNGSKTMTVWEDRRVVLKGFKGKNVGMAMVWTKDFYGDRLIIGQIPTKGQEEVFWQTVVQEHVRTVRDHE